MELKFLSSVTGLGFCCVFGLTEYLIFPGRSWNKREGLKFLLFLANICDQTACALLRLHTTLRIYLVLTWLATSLGAERLKSTDFYCLPQNE